MDKLAYIGKTASAKLTKRPHETTEFSFDIGRRLHAVKDKHRWHR